MQTCKIKVFLKEAGMIMKREPEKEVRENNMIVLSRVQHAGVSFCRQDLK